MAESPSLTQSLASTPSGAANANAATPAAPVPELTVLMPCLNEAKTLGFCIKEAQEWGAKSGVAMEVVIGDNGSTDGSQELARSLGACVIDVPVRGYGAAL